MLIKYVLLVGKGINESDRIDRNKPGIAMLSPTIIMLFKNTIWKGDDKLYANEMSYWV